MKFAASPRQSFSLPKYNIKTSFPEYLKTLSRMAPVTVKHTTPRLCAISAEGEHVAVIIVAITITAHLYFALHIIALLKGKFFNTWEHTKSPADQSYCVPLLERRLSHPPPVADKALFCFVLIFVD